jgi:hypothetical protein
MLSAVEKKRDFGKGGSKFRDLNSKILHGRCTRAIVNRELVSRISRGENLGLSVSIGDAAVHAASLLLVKEVLSRLTTLQNLRSSKLQRARFLRIVKHLFLTFPRLDPRNDDEALSIEFIVDGTPSFLVIVSLLA